MKKEQNGKESLRRLKPIVGCNASKKRKKICPYHHPEDGHVSGRIVLVTIIQ